MAIFGVLEKLIKICENKKWKYLSMTEFFLQINIKLSFGNVYQSFSSSYFSSWIMMLKLKVFLNGSVGLDHWYGQLHQLGLGWFEIDYDNQECGLMLCHLILLT